MKKLLLFSIFSVFSTYANAQCAYVGLNERTDTYVPGCTEASTTVGSGNFQRFTVTNGVWYGFNTCGSSYDTKITGFNSSGTYIGLYNDDNGSGNNDCGGGLASGVNWQATFSGEMRLQMNEYDSGGPAFCGTAQGSATLSYRVLPPSKGTYAVSTYYTCGSAGNIYTSSGATVTNSVSGSFGSITWQFGRPNGVWTNWTTGTSAPSSCCFPINPSPTQADRMRAIATNGPCTDIGDTVFVISDNMVAPTSANSSTTSICAASAPANITLSYSGGTVGVLGTARWYSGACGGTFVGSGNNLTISAPGESTLYQVRFENPCTQTSCASVMVEVTDIDLSTEIYDLSCFDSGDGAIELTVVQKPPTFDNSLEQWVMASSGVVTNVNNDVVRWQDLSGNNNHYVTNSGNGIKLESNSMNGEPAVRFNASGIMESPNFVSNPYTMIVVGKLNTGSGFFAQRLVSSGSINWLFGWWGGNRDRMFANGWVNQGPNTNLYDPYVYSVSGTGGLTSFYRNGTLVASNNGGVAAPGIISLGGWGTGNTEQSHGDVAEVLVYNKVLQDGERQVVEDYLNRKYAVSVAAGTETYSWSPGGATSKDISSLDANTYSVDVTKNGCTTTLGSNVVNERQDIIIIGTPTNEVCPADANGSITTNTTADASATPPAFNDLLIWTKADDGVVLDNSGDVVTWKDLSGNDNHFQVTFGNDVQLASGVIGGEDAIRLNGNNIMSGPQVINTDFTVIVVAKMNAGSNLRLVSSNTRNWLLGWWSNRMRQFFSEGWVYGAGGSPPTNTPVNTSPYIYTGTGNIGSDVYSFYENGALVVANDRGDQPPGALSIGGWGFSNSERSSGDVAEVIAYNRVLTSDERMALEKYLSDKYGIAVSHSGVNPTYSWSNGPTTEDISSLDNASYTLTVTDAAGCANNESFNVGTDKTESTANTGVNASSSYVCFGESVDLSVVGGSLGTNADWRWYSDASYSTFVGAGSPLTVNPNQTTTYYARAEGDCNNAGSLSVEVFVNGSSATPLSSVVLPGSTSSSTCTVNDANWHYFYNGAKELLAAVNSNGQNLGDVTVTITVGDSGPFGMGLQPNVCGFPGASAGEYAMPRYWDITSDNPPSGAVDVVFFYENADVASLVSTVNAQNSSYVACWGDVNSEADLMMTVEHSGGSTELFTGLSFANGPNTGDGQRQIAFQLSEFSGGKLHSNGGGNALPVELLSFEAKAINNEYIQLDWATATEINNAGFELLRSTDGVNFEMIAWIDGYGNSNQVNNYSYDDWDVLKGKMYYYRIKQVDYDGQYEYFHIESAKLDGSTGFSIGELIPNPSLEGEVVKVNVSVDTQQDIQIAVYNSIGKQVAYYTENLRPGSNEIKLGLNDLSSGTYFVSFQGGFGRETKNLVVIK